MKILLLTPQLPYPPRQGTSLRNYHIIRGLAGRHGLSLLSFAEGEPTAEALAVLEGLGVRVLTVPAPGRSVAQRLRGLLTSGQPDMAQRLASGAFEQALAHWLQAEAFAIVQIEGLELARYLPTIRRLSPASQIVFDNHNAETALQQRALLTDRDNPRRWAAAVYSWLQVGRLRRFESWACRTADALVAVSERDAAAMRQLSPQKAVTVIPNSIDVGQYDQPFTPSLLPGPFDLVFSGKMDYRPNVDGVLWFAEAVWPLLRVERPQTTWAIVGQKPHRQLERLKGEPGITLTGQVESIFPYLAASTLYIMPLRIGSGTRLKLLEAMAAGMAVVSTAVGAEGFPLQSGGEVMIADSAEQMAETILELLEDAERRRRLGTAARAFAASYDWRRVVPLFDEVYQRVTS